MAILSFALLLSGCGPGPVVQIDAGKDYVCARFERGDTECVNHDVAGGPLTFLRPEHAWYQLATPDSKLVSMSTHYRHFCGLDREGAIHCAGQPDFYEPVPVGSYDAVTAGTYSTCALERRGDATCWGTSFYDPSKDYYKGSDLEPPAGPFVHLYSHQNGYCGMRPDGTMSCWGHDSMGPASPPEGVSFSMIVADNSNTYCGTTSEGSVTCWGLEESAPHFQDFLNDSMPFEDAALGFEAGCVLRDDGEVRCRSLPGEDPDEYQPPAGVRFRQITAGYRFFCGLAEEPVEGRQVLCWGCRWDDPGVDAGMSVCEQPSW